MAEKPAVTANPAQTDAEADDDDEANGGQRLPRPSQEAPRSGQPADAFDTAFKKALKEVKGGPEETKPKPKPKPDADEMAKPASKKPAKAQAEDDGDDDPDGDQDADDAQKKPVAEKKPAQTEPLKAKPYWPQERRESFDYQPRSVQEAWLAEAPAPHGRWSQEQKDTFAKLPREAQEMLLAQHQDFERGFGQKFQALATERRIADGIRAAIPANVRELMLKNGVDELGVISKLFELQGQAMSDPVGYIKTFIAKANIDPRHIFGDVAGEGNGQTQPQQADIESHPAVKALKAEVAQLKGAVTNDLREREQTSMQQAGAEIAPLIQERDEQGALRYPYVRLLAPTMTSILNANPEQFASMGVKERFVATYKLALEVFPELIPAPTTAKPTQADEPEEDDADDEVDQQTEKLKKAASKKPKAPQTPPVIGQTSDDRFTKAFNRALKQLGHR